MYIYIDKNNQLIGNEKVRSATIREALKQNGRVTQVVVEGITEFSVHYRILLRRFICI